MREFGPQNTTEFKFTFLLAPVWRADDKQDLAGTLANYPAHQVSRSCPGAGLIYTANILLGNACGGNDHLGGTGDDVLYGDGPGYGREYTGRRRSSPRRKRS